MYNQIVIVGMGTQGVEIINDLIEEGIDAKTFAVHDNAKFLEKSQTNTKILLSVNEQNIEDRFIELTCQDKSLDLVVLIGNLGSTLAHKMKNFMETVYPDAKVLGIIPKDQNQSLQEFQALFTDVCRSFFKFPINSIIEELGDVSDLEIQKRTNFYIKSMVEMLINIKRYGFVGEDSCEVDHVLICFDNDMVDFDFLIGEGDVFSAFQQAIGNNNLTNKELVVFSVTGGDDTVDEAIEVAREKFGDNLMLTEKRIKSTASHVRISLLVL
jgi:hypothetical protein